MQFYVLFGWIHVRLYRISLPLGVVYWLKQKKPEHLRSISWKIIVFFPAQ